MWLCDIQKINYINYDVIIKSKFLKKFIRSNYTIIQSYIQYYKRTEKFHMAVL